MTRKKPKRSNDSRIRNWLGDRRVQIPLLLALIIVFGYFGVTLLGSYFQPAPPSPEGSTGYARIYLIDGATGEYVDTDGIHLINAYNITPWNTNMTTGTTFHVSTASVWWVNISGYYPIADTLTASGGSDPNTYTNNTMFVFKQADPSDVNVQLYRWKNVTTGVYNYSGFLPKFDGVYEMEIQITINMPSRNETIFGLSQWMPNYTLPSDSFAYNMSLEFVTLWFGWNATLYDYTLIDDSYWGYNDVYDINILNCTMVPACYYDATYKITGNFSNLQSLRVYDLTVDNYDNYVAMIV
jgi:hypothetical protein